jgi:hypothetical protein
LHQERVDVDEGGLQQVQGQHGHLLVLLVRLSQVALLAVEDDAIGAVPVVLGYRGRDRAIWVNDCVAAPLS